MGRLLRFLRRQVLGDEQMLARRADRRSWTPGLALLRRFEREFRLDGGEGIVLGRLTDPRSQFGLIGLPIERLRESHLAASGATGSGKTTAAIGLTRDVLRGGRVHLINLDPKGDTSAAVEQLAGEIPGEVKFVRPFDPHVVPQLRLTAREAGIPPEVQALSLVSSLEEATGAELGLRMRSIVTPLACAAIELDLPLSVIVEWLANPNAFAAAAGQTGNERLHAYARGQFLRESRESVSAIRSRLESVLLVPIVRRALEARTFMPITEWVERYHLNFDFSRPPAGQEAAVRVLCAPLVGRLTRALLNRSPGPASPHLWMLADELPELLGKFESVSFGRLLAVARSRAVSCFLLLQQRGQLPREFQELVRTNATIELVFRANHRDAATYAHALPVAEDEPSASALRASLVRRLERLPRRHFLLLVKDSPHGGQFLKAPLITLSARATGLIASWGDSVAELSTQPRPTPVTDPAQDAAVHLFSDAEPGEFPELG